MKRYVMNSVYCPTVVATCELTGDKYSVMAEQCVEGDIDCNELNLREEKHLFELSLKKDNINYDYLRMYLHHNEDYVEEPEYVLFIQAFSKTALMIHSAE